MQVAEHPLWRRLRQSSTAVYDAVLTPRAGARGTPMETLFKTVYFVGMLVEIILRFPYARQRRHIPTIDQRVSSTERGLLALLALGTFVLPLIHSLTAWLRFANYRWSPRTRAKAGSSGCLLLAAALWLFWRAHHDLGANWSPSLEIGTQHGLITHGVYRTIRHPMYASGWLLVLAQALLLQNGIAGLAGVLTFFPLYVLRVPREERMMQDHFGNDYRAYCAQTGRIVPRLRG